MRSALPLVASLVVLTACTRAPEPPPNANANANPNPNANPNATLNPKDGVGRDLLKGRDGRCYVVVPLAPQEQPTAPGAGAGRQYVPCAGILDGTVPEACFDAVISANAAKTSCTCVNHQADPPLALKVACPPWR